MGVPGFYSWLTRRYPLIKLMVGKQSLPQIDYLYLDMNGIIYKCVKDDSVIFKSQIMPKEFQEIWVQVFNYINMIVNKLKPSKMIFLALDGVAPRSKMNNQRSRRFKSARDYKQFIERFYGYNEQSTDSQQNFKNNSISPGTKFMQELNEMIHFFIQKKIEQDDYWKNVSVIFTGSDCPGEGQHKIMEWIRSNKLQFAPNDCHCLYGADADLIMLGLSLPMKNICIIREEYIHSNDKVTIKDSKKQKIIQFEMIFLTILREYFDVEYQQIKSQLKHLEYSISKIIKDFVFLFFFIGNDFLPRCMAYNIRERSIEKLIAAFKKFLIEAEDHVVGQKQMNIKQLSRLCSQVSKYEASFIEQKAQDARRFLQKRVQFDDEFAQVMSKKVLKQSQFLNQLKQFYMNQDQSIRSGFYKQKFNVDPAQKVEEFYTILGFYLHGLKFVYQYYFLNLSSWSWYYPYYYAPLLSDLSFYLNYLAESGVKLQQLELGQPSQPFKQLLCILPKQSSDLLPESFQRYLKDPESPLRTPMDFYPDHFEDDLYGSIRAHEAVSLIPFLDQQAIKSAYDQAITNVKPEDIRRNQLKKTRLYEYDENAIQITIKSPLSVIESFTCHIRIQQIQLLKEMAWVHMTPKTAIVQNILRMPTLHMKQHHAVVEDDKRSLRFLLQLTEPEDKEIKLGNHIYYGYPLQHSGRIQAILTKQTFQYNPDFKPDNYRLSDLSREYSESHEIKHRKKQLFNDLIDVFRKKELHYLNLKNVESLAFVIDTQYFNRTLSGAFQRVYTLQNDGKTYEIIPLGMVSKIKKYQITKSDFKFHSLEQQFPLGQEVLLAHPNKDFCGHKGKVVGYVNESKVKVKITQKLRPIKQQKLEKIVNTDEVFLELRFVAQIIKMKPDIALTILDTVSIQLPRQKNLPQSIDIGLNFICRSDNKIVPNLVRINYGKDHIRNQDPKKIFKHLELSVKAFQILLQYKRKYPQVLDLITARHHKLVEQAKANQKPINWRQKIKAHDIYQQDGKSQGKHQQTTRNLMKVYLWLIKNKETHMPLSSVYSKQISYKKIAKLEEYFKTQKDVRRKKDNTKLNQDEQITVDPNFLYSLKLSRKGFLYLSQRPQDHVIGDQVVCLHCQYFGHFGVIIGVDDDRYEVIFQKPSFGKSDLGGLCSNLWGGKFRYKQLMNIDLWPKYFKERVQSKKMLQNSGWIDAMKMFYPKFKSNPIKNFNDFQMVTKNQLIAKMFDPSTIQYVQKIRSELKQVEVDKDYIVVDNAKQDYHFKYDKNQVTVTQQQVHEMAKNKKWIEKSLTEGKNEDFEKQIIQNKLANITLEDKTIKVESQQKVHPQSKTDVTQKPEVKQVTLKPQVQQATKPQKDNAKKHKYVQKPIAKVQPKDEHQRKPVTEGVEFGQEQDAGDILG